MSGCKRVGCFVCNFNKKDYVVGCVESLLNQSYDNMDVYVVDNASTDGSVEALEQRFGDKIIVHVNESNLGGSGGFGKGISIALEKGYEYAVLVDNDVRVDQFAIENMVKHMEQNGDVGIIGAKILQMSDPDKIQDMGGSITPDYGMTGNYWGCIDKDIPDIVDGDYISTCTAMVRMSAARVFGSMPEENFIYWDDIELSRKCQLAGYRTIAIGNAKAWHKMQTANDTPFNRYYLTRNRFKFFSVYSSDEDLETFKEKTFEDIFSRSFMYRYKGKVGIAHTFINALEDFISGKYGKAQDGKIVEQAEVEPMLAAAIRGRNKISVKVDMNNPDHRFALKRIKEITDDSVVLHAGREFEKDESYLKIQICDHVKYVKENVLPIIMADRFMHCIATEEQFEEIKSFDMEYQKFKEKYWNSFSKAVSELRK